MISGVGEGVQAHPEKFWFLENPGQIPENPDKIPKHLGKIPEKPSKTGAQPCLTSKNGAQRLQKNKWRPFLQRSHHKKVFMIFVKENL